MENHKVGDITHGQLIDGINALLDKKLSSLATKEGMLVSSAEVKKLIEEKALKEEENLFQNNVQFVYRKLNDLENRSRRNNFIFKLLNWGENTVFKSLVKNSCIEVLKCCEANQGTRLKGLTTQS